MSTWITNKNMTGRVFTQMFVGEEIPRNIPKPRRKPMQMTVFIDANDAGDFVTIRSRTGALVNLYQTPTL
jgi:hypothetical protein